MKKWTYLVAAGMMLAATPVFTGCIDNDEPEGINILRKAKAELISAKKAVVEAEATRLKAEATYLEAQAELVKAQIKIAEAQALQIEAETEEMKAKYAAEIAKLQQETEKILQEMLAAQQAADDAHLKALEALRKAQAAAAEAEKDYLATYIDNYDEARKALYEAQDYLVEKNRALAAADNDVANGTHFTERLAANVARKQAKVDNAVAALAELEAELTELENKEIGALPARYEEVLAEIAQLKEEKKVLDVELAEAKLNSPLYTTLAGLEAELAAETEKEIAVDAFVNPIVNAPYWMVPGYEYIAEGSTFTVGENGPSNEYYEFIGLLNDVRNEAIAYQLDEDDKTWTAAKINELKVVVAEKEQALETAEKWFDEAVAGYNMGKGTKNNAYTGFKAFKTAIDKYNTLGASLDAVKGKVIAAEQKVADAAAQYNDETAEKTKQDAIDAAWATYEDAFTTAWTTYRTAYNTANAAVEAAKQASALREQELQVAIAELAQNPKDEALKQAKKDAETAVKDATKAITAAEKELNKVSGEEYDKYQKAEKVAAEKRKLAILEAEQEYDSNLMAWGNNQDPALKAALQQAMDELEALREVELNPQTEALEAALADVANAYYYTMLAARYDRSAEKYLMEFIRANSSIYDINSNTHELTTAILDIDAKAYLLDASNTAYGSWYRTVIDKEVDGARILNLDKEGIHQLIQQQNPGMDEYFYHLYYSTFGLLGQYLNSQVDVEQAQAYIDNADQFKTMIENIDNRLATLALACQEQAKAVKEAADAVTEQKLAISEFEATFETQKDAINEKMTALWDIAVALQKAIPVLTDEDAQFSTADKEKAIKWMEFRIKMRENDIEAKKADVEKAKKYLELAQEGLLDAKQLAQYDVEDAERNLERAQTAMDEAEEALNKAIARIEGSTEE